MIQSATDIHESFRGAHLLYSPASQLLAMTEYGRSEPRRMVKPLRDLATSRGCTKLEVMVPASQSSGYVAEGFVREARVGGFYKGREDCLVMSLCLDPRRTVPRNLGVRDAIINQSATPAPRARSADSLAGLSGTEALLIGLEPDMDALAAFYAACLPDAPEPLASAETLAALAALPGRGFYSLRSHGHIRAAGLLQTWSQHLAGQLDHVATAVDQRRRGHATALIHWLEQRCHDQGIYSVFAVTRAALPDMNLTLGHLHYRYGGTLVNHAGSPDDYEDANLWYKSIARPAG